MPFGKWRGTRVCELPDDYFAWLRTIDVREPLRTAIESEARRRELEDEERERESIADRGGGDPDLSHSPQGREAARPAGVPSCAQLGPSKTPTIRPEPVKSSGLHRSADRGPALERKLCLLPGLPILWWL